MVKLNESLADLNGSHAVKSYKTNKQYHFVKSHKTDKQSFSLFICNRQTNRSLVLYETEKNESLGQTISYILIAWSNNIYIYIVYN